MPGSIKQQPPFISIPKPCNQDWDLMSPGDGGRFCSHCAETVTDFTSFSNDELVSVLSNTHGRICGRLTARQLTEVAAAQEPEPRQRFYKLLAGIMLLTTAKNVAAQPQQRPAMQQTQYINHIQGAPETTKQDYKLLRGKIINTATKDPVPFAVIELMGSTIYSSTDSLGMFSLKIPDSLAHSSQMLLVSYNGYKTTWFNINRHTIESSADKIYTLKLDETDPDTLVKGRLMIVKKIRKRKWWTFWR